MGDRNEATAGKIFIEYFVLISFRRLKKNINYTKVDLN
jgi:hypothetical protein